MSLQLRTNELAMKPITRMFRSFFWEAMMLIMTPFGGVTMKRLLTAGLLGLFLLNGGQPQFATTRNPLAANRVSSEARVDGPSIVYLEWFGKNLVVLGEGFADGATVLINGQRVKTRNDGVSPTVVLIAKKARKKILRAQEITVQVENPNGEKSNEVPFYSGITIPSGTGNEPIRLHVDDVFLLYLTVGDPAAVKWSVGILGPDPTIVTQLSEPPPIPRSQGFFRVNKPGQFDLQAVGSPQCPPLPPTACTIAGASDKRFQVTIIVE
jgi:hypothetical protein